MSRSEARRLIREAAAGQRRRTNLRMAGAIGAGTGRRANLLPLPKLQQSVAICRAKDLVSDDVLVAAGFNPTGRNAAKDAAQAVAS